MSTRDFRLRIAAAMDALFARPEVAASDAANAGLVVALSGGPDSVALLLALQPWAAASGRPLAAAHFDHRLRGAEAAADASFCRDLCRRLEIPYHTEGADPRPIARRRGQGLEEAARHLRRTFCEGILIREPRYRWIATGHHRDDQTETVLMRLFRGTGPDGLRGIRPVAGRWLHPMLDVSRTEILGFLEAEGQAWRTDRTNVAGDNTRARLRRELLPIVRGIFGSGAPEMPARLAELLDDDLDLLDEVTAAWLADCRRDDGSLDLGSWADMSPAQARRILRAWLAAEGADPPERVHIENIRRWLTESTSGTSLDLPGGLVLTRNFDGIRVQQPGAALRIADDYRIVVGKAMTPVAPAVTGRNEGVGDPFEESTWSLTCPAGALRGNLQVRNWRRGDRFQPFGMQGTKKLSDLFRDRRITRDTRAGILVVTDGAGILWVVGLARSERTRLLPTTTRTVTISVVKRQTPNAMKDND